MSIENLLERIAIALEVGNAMRGGIPLSNRSVAELAASPQSNEVPAKKGPGRPRKVETVDAAPESAPAAAPQSAQADVSHAVQAPAPAQAAASDITDDMLRARIRTIIVKDAKQRPAIVALLTKFGAQDAAGLKGDNRAAFMLESQPMFDAVSA